jgi:hypothetical protein
VFHTRWVLSYLRGPLTRGQIKTLMDARRASPPEPPAASSAAPLAPAPVSVTPPVESGGPVRPLVPSGIDQRFLVAQHAPASDTRAIYRPALLGRARLHFARASFEVDLWRPAQVLAIFDAAKPAQLWESTTPLNDDWEFDDEAESTFPFAPSPAELSNEKSYAVWSKSLASHLYRTRTLTLWKCKQFKMRSTPGETEGEFKVRLAQRAKEIRDAEVEKLHKRYAAKLATLKQKIETAEAALERESQQYERAKYDSVVKIGSSLLGAMFGRKLASSTNVTRASTSMRSVGGAAQQRGDIGRAQEKLESLQKQLKELEDEFEREVLELSLASDIDNLALESIDLRPRKSDIQLEPLQVVWTPWQVDGAGVATPLFEAPPAGDVAG